MTAPTPSISVGNLVNDVKTGLTDVIAVLAFIDKFAAFLPAQYRLPLEELQKLLQTVDSFLSKV
jgi:hypothetical protein